MELDASGTAETENLRIDKVITVGATLGNYIYRSALLALLRRQNFLENISVKPSFVGKWQNYYAKRDLLSSILPFADLNERIDHDPGTGPYADELNNVIRTRPGTPKSIAAAADLLKITPSPVGTYYWHRAYFSELNIPLNSISKTYTADLYSVYVPDYFH